MLTLERSELWLHFNNVYLAGMIIKSVINVYMNKKYTENVNTSKNYYIRYLKSM